MEDFKKKYIGYYRVSTQKQGESGLGLSSQKQLVTNFISGRGDMVNEYTEVETGKNSNRPKLLKAIEECKSTNSTLVIAKLDRLSRNAKFIFTLRDSKVDFICADVPEANSLTIGILAVLAQDEAERISSRTKLALGQIKDKISKGIPHVSKKGNIVTKLGNGRTIPNEVRLSGVRALRDKAYNNPESIKTGGFIISMINNGLSFKQVTDELNKFGFKTPKGCDFSIVQTQRLYDRYQIN